MRGTGFQPVGAPAGSPCHTHRLEAGATPFAILLAVILAAPLRAQQQILLGDDIYDNPAALTGAGIEDSPAIENLFSRAAEGAARGDWKFAIDSLQRIIEDENGALVPVPPVASNEYRRYESARRRAIREVAALPPEGLAAYRLLYDGKAKRLLEQARAGGDAAAARELADRYLLTNYGDDACDLLASWALDEGRPAEALTILQVLGDLVPEYAGAAAGGERLPEPLIAGKQAAAYAMLGRTDEAREALARAGANASGDAGWLADVLKLPVVDEALTVGRQDWRLSGGSGRRTGMMPAVEPTLMDITQWQVELPEARSDLWQRSRIIENSDSAELPVSSPIAAGGTLFARTATGVLAVEAEGMAVRWTARTSEHKPVPVSIADAPVVRQMRGGRMIDFEHASGDPRDPEFADHVAGGLSLCHGLLMTIERDGGSVSSGIDNLDMRTRRMVLFTGGVFPSSFDPTRLVATNAKDGNHAWQRGRNDDPNDPLGAAQFRAAPIEVGADMWVPFIRGNDLLVAVLDPRSGALRQEILLCYVEASTYGLEQALDPAVADGVVFVPTGNGLLVAVDAAERRPRWATQYREPGADESRRHGRREGRWHPGPPVVAGGRVLLAPSDSPDLFALSADSGSVLWTAGRPAGGWYILAADQRHVWVGGAGVTCLSARDGKTEWSAPLESVATGRAALSGDRILVPTLRGLEVVVAETGRKMLGQTISEAQQPLGNLLCWDDALFSLDPTALRKYPDLAQAYPRAVERFAADPSSVPAAMRLAWLELLRKKPRESFDVLRRVGDEAYAEGQAQASELAHLRVEVLLALADVPGIAHDEVMHLVDEAARFARATTDRLRVDLRAGKELSAAGRHAEAFTRLYDLARSAAADELTIRADGVRVRERLNVAAELARIGPQLTTAQREAWRTEAEAQIVRTAVALGNDETWRDARAALARAADIDAVGAPAQQALLALGKWEAQRGRLEAAEQCLARAARLNADSDLTAAAHMLLADLYADSRLRLFAPAADSLDELVRRFATAGIPAAYVQLGTARQIGEPPRESAASSLPATIGAWAAAARARLPKAELRAQRFDELRPGVSLEPDRTWAAPDRAERRFAPRMVYFDDPRPPALGTRALFYDQEDTLVCRDVRTFEPVWRAELRVPEEFRAANSGLNLFPWMGPEQQTPETHRAAADGQIMVIRGDYALHAVGLVTGKRLWTRTFDVPDAHSEMTGLDYALAAGGGYVVGTPRSGRLTAMRAIDGSTVWERDLRGEEADNIWIWEDRVAVIDARHEHVHLFDLADGRLVRQVIFQQPDPDNAVVSLVRVGDVLCGPWYRSDQDAIVAVDVRTGEERWRRPINEESAIVSQLFRPAPDMLGVSLLGGGVLLLEGATGEDVQRFRANQSSGAVDGVVAGRHAVFRWYDGQRGVDYPRLVGFDLQTGKELWGRDDFAPADYYDEPLRAYGADEPTIPALVDKREIPGIGASGPFHLHLLSVRTGESVGEGIELIAAGARSELGGDFGLWADAFIYNIGAEARAHPVRLIDGE